MFKRKSISKYILLISLLYQNILCQQISTELLGGWGEKPISDPPSQDLDLCIEATEKYLSSEGYDLNEMDVIPIGFFTQSNLGINYRLLSAVKKKSDTTPTIYDIRLRKTGTNDMKIISNENPGDSSVELSEKDQKKMKIAIMKFYFEKLYKVSGLDIQYEYHNINGLNKYAIYDVEVELKNDKEIVNKRVVVIYRNDKTFTVEQELVGN
jgi:hypothetical protein